MAGNVPFLMKDIVLVVASVYLLKQDVARVSRAAPRSEARSRPGKPEGDTMNPA